MLTPRDEELKAQIAACELNIEAQKVIRKARMERVELIDMHIISLEKRKLMLKAQLEREAAPLVKPTGHCVIEKAHDGVSWRV